MIFHKRSMAIIGFLCLLNICILSVPIAADEPGSILFKEMYGKGMKFSEKLTDLDGKPVIIKGFMAPPLKPDSTFFVLTKMPKVLQGTASALILAGLMALAFQGFRGLI